MIYLMETNPYEITSSGIILGIVLATIVAVINGNDNRFR